MFTISSSFQNIINLIQEIKDKVHAECQSVCLGFFSADAMLFWQITCKPENHSVKMSQAPPKPSNFYLERGILVRSVRTTKTVKRHIDFDSKLQKGCITSNFNVFFY